MNKSREKDRCTCGRAEHRNAFDAEAAYQVLSRKYTELADRVARYMSDAGLERSERNVRAMSLAREVERIVGGRPTTAGAYPDCCLVGTRFANGAEQWFCTGVLIHPRIALTAAHCQDPQGPGINVVALAATRQSDLRRAEIVSVRRVVVHPEYPSSKGRDVSVLILRRRAATAAISVASAEEIAGATRTLLVGFGNNDVASSGGFGVQREVEVDIASLRRTASDDLDADEARFGYESDFEFVAGNPGKDTCNGDSGGPAFVAINGVRKLAGLTSRATADALNPCGDGGIYTRVDVHVEFIRRLAEASGIHDF